MNNRCYQFMIDINNNKEAKDMKLRVVDYARVSTDSIAQRNSFLNQKSTYQKIIEDNPNWEYVGSYSDEAVTGTKAYLRGGFQQMITDATVDVFDMIIVKDVPRFARNMKECLVYVDKLKSLGVMVYFVKENINTFNKSQEMLLGVMAMGAQMEAESARSRTKIVFQQGIKAGKIYGNSKILGYQKDHCKLVINEAEAEIVRLIFHLYVHERMGLRRIAKELALRGNHRSDGTDIPTRTISCVLENPKYKGFYCGGKTEKIDVGERYVRTPLSEDKWVMYRDSSIPAIVSEELWDAAAAIRAARKREHATDVKNPCNQGIYRYSGKIVSDIADGISYTRTLYRYNGIEREAWQCRNHKDMTNTSNVGPTLYSDELDTILQSIVTSMLGGYDAVIDDLLARYTAALEQTNNAETRAKLEAARDKAKQKCSRLLDLYVDGTITKEVYSSRAKAYDTDLQKIESQIDELQKFHDKREQLRGQLADLKAHIAQMAKETVPSKETIETIVDRIHVCKESTKKEIHIDVRLKLVNVNQKYHINRTKAGTEISSCICCNRHLSM